MKLYVLLLLFINFFNCPRYLDSRGLKLKLKTMLEWPLVLIVGIINIIIIAYHVMLVQPIRIAFTLS